MWEVPIRDGVKPDYDLSVNEIIDRNVKAGKKREMVFGQVLIGNRQVEVKYQRKCEDTGYVFIEFLCHGKPSGIKETTADYWALEVLPERWIIIKTEELLKITREVCKERAKLFATGYVSGGDSGAVGVKVPVHRLIPHGTAPAIG